MTPRIRGADEIEGFAYLRSAVFDRDLDFENEYRWFYARDPEGLRGFKETFLDRREPATGRPINFAPLGSALLWSPFYLLAHAGVAGRARPGIERGRGRVLAPLRGRGLLRLRALRLPGLLLVHRRWSASAASAGRGDLAGGRALAGTPVLYYMTLAPPSPTRPRCSRCSLLALAPLRARPAGTAGNGRVVGAAGGLAGLVREQDVLFLVVPAADLAWQCCASAAARADCARLAAGAGRGPGFVPQLLAYRAMNGSFGPSRLVARKMSSASPHFFEVLFDPGHGLFAWTPAPARGRGRPRRRAPCARGADAVPLALLAGASSSRCGSTARWRAGPRPGPSARGASSPRRRSSPGAWPRSWRPRVPRAGRARRGRRPARRSCGGTSRSWCSSACASWTASGWNGRAWPSTR